MQLIKKILYTGTIEVKTGLHIGGSKENLNIGGIDNAIIRDPFGQVYIPGSSLKGKMRSLVELAEGTITSKGNPTEDPTTNAGLLFGTAAGDKANTSRLIVRDCYPLDNDVLTEIKTEVNINRIKGTSLSGPRKMERVAAGTLFHYEMVLNIFDADNEEKLTNTLHKAMRLLEQDYLGGSGSRGYGQVAFCDHKEDIIFKAQ